MFRHSDDDDHGRETRGDKLHSHDGEPRPCLVSACTGAPTDALTATRLARDSCLPATCPEPLLRPVRPTCSTSLPVYSEAMDDVNRALKLLHEAVAKTKANAQRKRLGDATGHVATRLV